MRTYPAIRFFTRYGEFISAGFGLAIAAAALWLVLAHGFGWGLLVVGAVAGTAAGFLCMVFAELTRIISEMMLPP